MANPVEVLFLEGIRKTIDDSSGNVRSNPKKSFMVCSVVCTDQCLAMPFELHSPYDAFQVLKTCARCDRLCSTIVLTGTVTMLGQI